jgi:predicted membrane chloride channel (bestrophin family)
VLRSIAPDRGIDNISPFYFTVMGTCLSFVLVFKSNIAYNRHATARLKHTPWIRRHAAQTHTLDSQSRTAPKRPRSLAERRTPAARAFCTSP